MEEQGDRGVRRAVVVIPSFDAAGRTVYDDVWHDILKNSP